MKVNPLRAPTIVETMRMNLSQAETALATGDGELLGRSIDAFGPMLVGLKRQAQDLGGGGATEDEATPTSITILTESAIVVRSVALDACDGRPVTGDVDQVCEMQRRRGLRAFWRAFKCRPTYGAKLGGGALAWLVTRRVGLFLQSVARRLNNNRRTAK